MRRITLWLLSTISALVLLFSYHTSTSSASSTSIVTPATDGTDAAAGASGSASASNGTGAGTTATPSAATGTESAASAATPQATTQAPAAAETTAAATTFDGTAVNTRYGPVQVQITVEGGKITKSIVLQVPWTDRKDQEINSRAVPVLNSETVAAQSSQIDMVSGATYTSNAYVQSLQSAIDQAHLA